MHKNTLGIFTRRKYFDTMQQRTHYFSPIYFFYTDKFVKLNNKIWDFITAGEID